MRNTQVAKKMSHIFVYVYSPVVWSDPGMGDDFCWYIMSQKYT